MQCGAGGKVSFVNIHTAGEQCLNRLDITRSGCIMQFTRSAERDRLVTLELQSGTGVCRRRKKPNRLPNSAKSPSSGRQMPAENIRSKGDAMWV